MRLRPGLRSGPLWGSLRRSPDPLVGWAGYTHAPLDDAPLGALLSRYVPLFIARQHTAADARY